MTDRPGRKRRVSDEEILDVFRETDKPALPTSAVADELPIKKRGTLKRLNMLRDEGALQSMDVGPRGQVWYLPDEESNDDNTEGERRR